MSANIDAIRHHAETYAKTGWVHLRIDPARSGDKKSGKRPLGGKRWQDSRPTPAEYSDGENIGVLLGAASGDLADIDLDCEEVRYLAPWFLPATGAIFGRTSAPRSHWLYQTEPAEGQKWQDPTRGVGEAKVLVELRSSSATSSAQTVFPPSVHWTGEPVAWDVIEGIARVPRGDLERAVGRLAAAALLARHWQQSRAECSMALSGGFARTAWTDNEIVHFVTAVSACANRDGEPHERDGEPEKRLRHLSKAREKIAAGEPCMGFPKLVEKGLDKRVVATAIKWLGLPYTLISDEERQAIASVVASGLPPGAEVTPIVLAPLPAAPVRTGVRCQSLVQRIMEQAKLPTVDLAFPKLNARLGGLSLHSITLIVAGTGKGKSSLAGEIAAHHAKSAPVVYYLGEMTEELMVARIIGQRRGVAWIDVVKGKVSIPDMEAALDGLNLWMVPRQADPVAAIKSTLAEARSSCSGTPMLVIDYVQLLADVGKDMRLAVMTAARDLRALIEAEPVVAIVLSQPSRGGSEKLRDGAANAEDLVGTGAETSELENGATNVLTIAGVSADDTEEHELTINVSKSRLGTKGKVGFRFNGRTGRWSETGAPVLAKGEVDRGDEILEQVRVHEVGRCLGGAAPCMRDLTASALTLRNGPHKVAGNKDAVLRTVKRLEKDGAIRRRGNSLELARKPSSPADP